MNSSSSNNYFSPGGGMHPPGGGMGPPGGGMGPPGGGMGPPPGFVDVFILNDEVETYNQLQILLDRAPNLYSLKLICGKFSLPELALFKISSVSVRRLDLYGYIEYNDWQWFNKEQCLALSNSPLGIQCEVLRIKIENPIDVLELVYSMSHLRALNVQILNDPHNIPGLELPQTEDELLQFFQSSLDSTCILTRNEYDPRFIQLWIR
ncbi:unnamed protein product [Rotaria sp. Silwood1]|nr:unnamed protein product [Rotaria sp. Silwood1]